MRVRRPNTFRLRPKMPYDDGGNNSEQKLAYTTAQQGSRSSRERRPADSPRSATAPHCGAPAGECPDRLGFSRIGRAFTRRLRSSGAEQAVDRYLAWARARGERRSAEALHADPYVAMQFMQEYPQGPWHADFMRSVSEARSWLPSAMIRPQA
jgi:hypothetical protein